jgi:hypothetical protein
MCITMVGTSPLGSNNLNNRLGGKSSPHQNQIKSQNFNSKKFNQQARMSPKTSGTKGQENFRNSPNKFESASARSSAPTSTPSRSSAPTSAPLRIASSQENRRDRHRSYSSTASSMSISPSSTASPRNSPAFPRNSPSYARNSPSYSRNSPAFSFHSNSPSPKLSSSFASSTCYQAPTPACLPLPPTQWISTSSPPPSPSIKASLSCPLIMKTATPLSVSPMADPSQHLKTLLKVLA